MDLRLLNEPRKAGHLADQCSVNFEPLSPGCSAWIALHDRCAHMIFDRKPRMLAQRHALYRGGFSETTQA
jgi:hypothetical protein